MWVNNGTQHLMGFDFFVLFIFFCFSLCRAEEDSQFLMRASNYTLRFISTRSVVGGAFKVIFQRACIRYIPVKGDKGVKIRTIPSIPNYETEQICKYTVKVRLFFSFETR